MQVPILVVLVYVLLEYFGVCSIRVFYGASIVLVKLVYVLLGFLYGASVCSIRVFLHVLCILIFVIWETIKILQQYCH